MKKLDVLECTLRDASYSIDFQFDVNDTAIIARLLEDAGFRFIEIGHGVGLDASEMGKGIAASTDEEYLKVASENIKKAKFGMFFIPGIGRRESINLAVDYGMEFIRIGTDITRVDEAEEYIKLAKKYDMYTSSNLMKTYAITPQEALEQARKVVDWGVDIVTVVDSAGGMLPHEVKEYIGLMYDNLDVRLGFHGHNNFTLGVANTLAAIEAGATIVDSTLQGLGRSAGNTPTEILLIVLEKLGYDLPYDIGKTLAIGEKYIKPLIKKQGIDPLDVVSGYALFHSSFTKTVFDTAKEQGVDPLDLIVEVSKIDKVKVSSELAEKAAKNLKKEGKGMFVKPKFRVNETSIALPKPLNEESFDDHLNNVLRELKKEAGKTGKTKVLAIAKSLKNEKKQVSRFLRFNESIVVAHVDIVDLSDIQNIVSAVADDLDYLAVDRDLNFDIRNIPENLKAIYYNDFKAMTSSIFSYITTYNLENFNPIFYGNNNYNKHLSIQIQNNLSINSFLIDSLSNEAYRIVIDKNNMESYVSFEKTEFENILRKKILLVNFDLEGKILDNQFIKNIPNQSIILDTGLGNLTDLSIKRAKANDITIRRISMEIGLLNELMMEIESSERLNIDEIERTIDGIKIVPIGIVGEKGSLVVDSIQNPTKIIGVADGKGSLLDNISDYKDDILRINKMILLTKISNTG
ncbi:MAG: hypothetical protein ACTSO5_03475 [Candidatus Heimdallarchaeaceae archaeon]